jgi:hypothetical protein
MIKIHYYKEKEHIMTLQKTNLILPIILILNVSINLVGMETAYIPDVLVANPIEYLIKAKTT